MPYQESSFTESTSPFPRPARDYRWASWVLLALVTFSATTAIIASVRLHRHANTRNHITQELTAIETQATAHAGVVWRGLTMLLAKEQMLFIQVRGEEQQGRINLFNRIEALQEIEKQGGVLNQKLGFSPSAELLKELDDRTLAFLGDVQGTFALMDLSTQQVRRRLRYHDMKFADFKESLSKIKVRDDQIAAAAANIANGVTVLASGITLLTATLFVFRLGRLRIQRDRALRHQALHDPLTNLPNRRQFQQRFNALTPDQRQNVAILFVDLDGFKRVNDSYGHQTGDQLLVTTVSRIGACLGPNDILSRQGGDEFILLVKSDPVRVADQIQKTLAPPFNARPKEVFISASIGILPNVGSLTADQAAQRADIAMYAAKQAGKAQAMVFADHMLKGAPQRLALETDFRRALERDEFRVVYQPKVGFHSGKMESVEALVRWDHPTRGFVGPDEFIPFAEETGLVSQLGRLVLEKACQDAVRWQDQGIVVAVNLSPIQFRNPKLIDEVRNALSASGLNPRQLELEITESAVLGDVQETLKVLGRLKALGVRLAIDDFGTGYSNLAHLKHFNVDVLKIDQAFVRGDSNNSEKLSDGTIVKAVIGMAKAFGMHVVAEGVESEGHVNALRELGADLGQGYYFSKPVDCNGIDAFLVKELEKELAEDSDNAITQFGAA